MTAVTVVIPTFGRPELVLRAVRSVLAQTMTDFEILVVIDGADPATQASLATIDDHRLRVIVHDAKKGASQARNTGADAGRGLWVAFLDDDDEWAPRKLERQLAIAPNDKAVVMTLSRVVDSTGEFIRPGEPYRGSMPVDEWLFGRRTWTKGGQSFLQTSSLMVPRAMFETLRFADTRQHEEWELAIRAVKQLGYSLNTVEEPLVVYYVPDNRPALSHESTWSNSLGWIRGMTPLVTRKAYSGFCLTVIARVAVESGRYDAILPLLGEAFSRGSPTPRQLFAFALLWALPQRFRKKLRAWMQGSRGPVPALGAG